MNFKLLFSFVFVGFVWLAQAQTADNKYIKDANNAFRSEKYCDATAKCALAYSKISRKGAGALKLKGEMAFKTAESYRLTENPKDASDWYEKAILLKYEKVEPLVLFYNAEMLRIMGDFPKAIANYKAYKALVPEDKLADVGLKSCEMNKDFKANKTPHVVTNEEKLNADGFEMAPMISDKKGNSIYYSSSRPNEKSGQTDPRTCESYMDLWVAQLDKKGNWEKPTLVADLGINTEDNEGTVCFDGKFKTMFFTRCPNEKKQNLGCDIWISELKGKNWGEPVKMNLKGSDTISVGHPCVSDDGKFLIFASDMPGGFGGRDLWYTTYDKKSDSWSMPVNMGPEVNTPGNELFPSFALNGDLLYASDGLPGLGGLDIFRAARVGEQNKWENPTNIGFPLNSESNDYAMVEVTEKKGYYTSERKGSKGKNYKPDVWRYELPPNLFDLKVIVSEFGKPQKKLADVQVIVKGTDGSTWEGFTNKDGVVFWDKKPNGDRYVNEESSYTVTLGPKTDYKENTKGEKFSTVGLNYDQSFIIDMELVPDIAIRLPEVRYALGKWDLLIDSTINSKDSLLFVYDLLIKYPGLILELSSHTDSRSNDKFNEVLSDNRAKSCYKFLVEEKGIDPRRLLPVGQGEYQPRTIFKKGTVYMESKPEDMTDVEVIKLTETYINKFKKDKRTFELLHQFNRRTEGRVISMDFDDATAEPANPIYLEFKPLPRP